MNPPASLFDVILEAHDSRQSKPDPEIYLTAANALGILPAECIAIEDAPNGVQAARAGGFACIAVTNSAGAEDLAGADLVVPALAGLSLDDVRSQIEGHSASNPRGEPAI